MTLDHFLNSWFGGWLMGFFIGLTAGSRFFRVKKTYPEGWDQ